MVRIAALAILLALSACEHAAGDLGRCYDGAFTSFCVVKAPAGTAVAPGAGIVPGTGMLLLGVGSTLSGDAAAAGALAVAGR